MFVESASFMILECLIFGIHWLSEFTQASGLGIKNRKFPSMRTWYLKKPRICRKKWCHSFMAEVARSVVAFSDASDLATIFFSYYWIEPNGKPKKVFSSEKCYKEKWKIKWISYWSGKLNLVHQNLLKFRHLSTSQHIFRNNINKLRDHSIIKFISKTFNYQNALTL